MSKLLNSLRRNECTLCRRLTLVRERALPGRQRAAQVCVRCVPVDALDMTHDSHKLVAAGY